MMISEAEAENIDARLVQVRQKQKELRERIARLHTEMDELEEEKRVLVMIRVEIDPPEKFYQPHNPDNILQRMVGTGYRLLTQLEMIRHKMDAKTAFPLLEMHTTWGVWTKASPVTLRSDVTYRVPRDVTHNPENMPEDVIGEGYRMLRAYEFEQHRRNWEKNLPGLEFATKAGAGKYAWWPCAEQAAKFELLPAGWTYRIPVEEKHHEALKPTPK